MELDESPPGDPLVTPEERAATAGQRCGRWIIRRHIAAGGFGDVFEVEHEESRRLGALKLLRAELCSDRRTVLRFEREVSLLRTLSLEGTAAVHDFGFSSSGQPFVVLELLHGEDLRARVRRLGRMPPAEALAILEAVSSVLNAAHSLGVVHRDVKPSNVFLTTGSASVEKVVLLDFGLGKLIDSDEPQLTASHQILGTPASMAPEQILGASVEARTDVYALGALAFYLLAGRPPFYHDEIVILCQLHLHARVPNVSAAAPVSPAADAVIARAMSKRIEHRHPSCRSFVAALRDALAPPVGVRRTAVGLVCVRPSVELSPRGELDAALMDDCEGVLSVASAKLAAAGLILALRTGDSAAFFLEIHENFRGALNEARTLRVLARELRLVLQQRPAGLSEVRVDAFVGVGHAVLNGNTLVECGALDKLLAR